MAILAANNLIAGLNGEKIPKEIPLWYLEFEVYFKKFRNIEIKINLVVSRTTNSNINQYKQKKYKKQHKIQNNFEDTSSVCRLTPGKPLTMWFVFDWLIDELIHWLLTHFLDDHNDNRSTKSFRICYDKREQSGSRGCLDCYLFVLDWLID